MCDTHSHETCPFTVVCWNSLGVQSNGNIDFKIHHSIMCMSRYFPDSVSYRAIGRVILSSLLLFTLAKTKAL